MPLLWWKMMMTGSTESRQQLRHTNDPKPRSARANRLWGAAAMVLIATSLVSCAPEPGATTPPDTSAGTPSKEELAEGKGGAGDSWSEENPEGVGEKTADLPESFPSDAFVIPEGTVIDDAGERSQSEWFVVLRAEDSRAGAMLWARVINLSAFKATDLTAGEAGETFATLTNATLTADAMMIPRDDDGVLLSYEVSLTG